MEISSRTLIPLFRPGLVHSDSASLDDCGRMFPDKLHVSSIPEKFPHYAWTAEQSAHSDFVGSRVYTCLGVICHLHFWPNDRGLLRATAVTQGWNGHRIRVTSEILLWRRKFSRRFCQDSNSQPFDSSSSSNTLSRACECIRKHKHRPSTCM